MPTRKLKVVIDYMKPGMAELPEFHIKYKMNEKNDAVTERNNAFINMCVDLEDLDACCCQQCSA